TAQFTCAGRPGDPGLRPPCAWHGSSRRSLAEPDYVPAGSPPNHLLPDTWDQNSAIVSTCDSPSIGYITAAHGPSLADAFTAPTPLSRRCILCPFCHTSPPSAVWLGRKI